MRLDQCAQARWLTIAWCLVFVLAGQAACKKAVFESDGDGGQYAGNRDGSSTKDVPSDATQPGTCPASTPSHSKAKGQSCNCNRECQSEFCVDGVCCGSACTETCKACNLPSSLGDCAFVPAGARPSDSSMCPASTPATCGLDGTCDGKGVCRKYVHGSECKAGTCDGDAVVGIGICDGAGNCSESKSQPCPPYTCDKNTNRCASRCSSDDQCSAGHQCSANSCGKSTNGAVCDDNSGCLSGFCVDGVCCNIACSGPCVSCNQTGSAGRCSYIGNELPDPECAGEDSTKCGHTGLCDGAGRCTVYLRNTPCSSSSCSGAVENTQNVCDGQGSCVPSQVLSIECAPFLCSNGACETSCDPKAVDPCEPGHACVPVGDGTRGVCGKRKNGQVCQSADDCDSGHCVDGVCCENSCEGPCRSCNLAGAPGLCLNAADDAQDPRRACRDLSEGACSTNGRCDGKGGCQMYADGTHCGAPEACVGEKYTPPSTCQSGDCQPSTVRDCNPYKCNGAACFGSCTNDAQCTDGNFCQKASCGLKPNGTDCSENAECKSGFCAQGVCCNSACADACMACNLTATAGSCKAVADNAPDPQGKCLVSATSTCGTTGTCRGGACATYDKGTPCKGSVCAGTTSLTPTSTCDGKGTCATPNDVSCGLSVCKNGTCKAPCITSADCVSPATCVNGTCTVVGPGTGGHAAGGAPGTGGRAAGGAPGTGGNGRGGAPGTGGNGTGGAPGTGGNGTGGAPGTGGSGTGGAPGTGGSGTGGAPGTGGSGTGGAPGTGGAGDGGAPGTGGAGDGGAPGTGGAGQGGAPGTGGAGEGGVPGTGGAGDGGAPGTGGAGEGGAPGTGGAGEGGAPGTGGAGDGGGPGTGAPLMRASALGGTFGSRSGESLSSAIWSFFFD
jgi:hypothetical protein